MTAFATFTATARRGAAIAAAVAGSLFLAGCPDSPSAPKMPPKVPEPKAASTGPVQHAPVTAPTPSAS